MDRNTTLEELKNQVREFNSKRGWDDFLNPKDLVLAMTEELGELARNYVWKRRSGNFGLTLNESVKDELADLLIYLIIFSYRSDTDISDAVISKLKKNALKYPESSVYRKSRRIHKQ